MAILYAVLRSLSKGIVQTPVFFITGVVLAVLLVIQFSLMIGAMQAKDAADSAELYLNQLNPLLAYGLYLVQCPN